MISQVTDGKDKAEVKSYFQQRMDELGVTPEINLISIHNPVAEFPASSTYDIPIFSEDRNGNIDIIVTRLDRSLITYSKEGTGKTAELNAKVKEFKITRLRVPYVKPNGEVMKYSLPKGQGTYPFFPPWLIEKYEKKEKIHTLFLIEGYFKAFKGAMHGLDIVGVSSITHLKEKTTGALHPDILKLMQACDIKRLVWLTDGDCLDITKKEIDEQVDLYKRPKQFFTSANTFKTILDDYEVEKWFAHVDSDNIDGRPKGLDDLLIALRGKEDEVVADLLSFSKKNTYFYKDNISFGTNRLHRYFRLNSVNEFYLFHVERRKDLKNKEFTWNGTKYQWSDEKSECVIKVPGEAKNYFRVGDQYHEFVFIPNKYKELERTFHRRQKVTIIDDYGKPFVTHIPKYKAFCNVPDHLNFQQVIHSNFNIYSRFEHDPDQQECTTADCATIIKFLTHIFGSGTIDWKHPKTGEKKTISEVDLGLDYMQLLYQNPTQTLPILCLVSRENNTGKSTMAKLLKLIFTANVAIVGNAELADNFNASWASKLLIICDEAKIDKQLVVEKVKSLSTADKIMMNAKGKDHVEIDFFGKFLFLTNNEENFIYASDDDVRYWVRKVPVIKDLNVGMLTDMQDEIPAFLGMLNKRKMVSECLHRAWFDPGLIKTDALKRVIAYSMPTIEKELRQLIKDMFLDFGCDEILMSRKAIHKEFFNNKFEANYLEHVIKNRLKVDLYHELEKDEKGELVRDLLGEPVKKYIVKRHSYPRWEFIPNGTGKIEQKRVDVPSIGRPFVFYRKDFLTSEEILQTPVDPEMRYINDNVLLDNKTNGEMSQAPPPDSGDLPY